MAEPGLCRLCGWAGPLLLLLLLATQLFYSYVTYLKFWLAFFWIRLFAPPVPPAPLLLLPPPFLLFTDDFFPFPLALEEPFCGAPPAWDLGPVELSPAKYCKLLEPVLWLRLSRRWCVELVMALAPRTGRGFGITIVGGFSNGRAPKLPVYVCPGDVLGFIALTGLL